MFPKTASLETVKLMGFFGPKAPSPLQRAESGQSPEGPNLRIACAFQNQRRRAHNSCVAAQQHVAFYASSRKIIAHHWARAPFQIGRAHPFRRDENG
jgi:hypothetical protein